MAEAAHGYAARGWGGDSQQPRGKRPRVVWREFRQRIASAGEIDRWFRHWPDANVGIVTGHVWASWWWMWTRHGSPDSVARAVRCTDHCHHGGAPPAVAGVTCTSRIRAPVTTGSRYSQHRRAR
jgi:hypothetical protein